MTESNVLLQPAYILRHKKYAESSLIIDVLTRDFGVLSILAKGVRKKKSRTAGLLLSFTALKLSYIGKQELKLLTHVELDESIKPLYGLSLYCGFYVNELIICFLHKNDPYPELFEEYRRCLALLLDTEKIEQVLRFFELNLIEYVGYGLQLDMDNVNEEPVQKDRQYDFLGGVGMIASQDGAIRGETLLALSARTHLSQQTLYEAKQLMRRVIDFHLQGRLLKSRAVLAKIIKKI